MGPANAVWRPGYGRTCWSSARSKRRCAGPRSGVLGSSRPTATTATPPRNTAGVLTWDDHGRFTARGFAPQRKEGDRKFFTPPTLVAAMYTGLAHYHFHAQSHDHAAYAGPGRGDLAFTEALRANTLVLTFVDRDTLNLDLALPGGVVLDLGSVVRPQSGADAR